jgi:outer membrane biosynthesis protein TonB
MPTITPKTDPEPSLEPEDLRAGTETQDAASAAPETPTPGAPLTFVPHDPNGAKPIRTIRTGRYGELEEHELIHLLDTIEDERARGRFRESIYISLFVWLAIAWVVLYGPRYLWHAPQLLNPADVLRQREMVQLNAPLLSHVPAPTAHPTPKPTLDNKTLEHLRAMAPPAPAPPPPTQPIPSNAAPSIPAPVAPSPTATRPAPPIAEAPAPQPATRPNFSTPGTAGDAIQQAIQNSAKHPGGGSISTGGSSGPLNMGGVDILSDTQGVNFEPYLRRVLRQIYQQWLPLIPEEARPPLSKQGVTQIRFSIGPDGNVSEMHLDGSTHDDALNRAAWGSINGQQFPPLPKQFTGPSLELRIHFLVNKTTE